MENLDFVEFEIFFVVALSSHFFFSHMLSVCCNTMVVAVVYNDASVPAYNKHALEPKSVVQFESDFFCLFIE